MSPTRKGFHRHALAAAAALLLAGAGLHVQAQVSTATLRGQVTQGQAEANAGTAVLVVNKDNGTTYLRYAEALAHLGDAEGFWQALGQAHPVDLAARVPSAAPRQANCYYSSSDAAFADRADASAHYVDALAGRVPLEGGWRVYSSGAGIALGLLQRCLLGLRPRADACVIDPVVPPSLGTLRADTQLAGRALQLTLEPGPQGHGVLTVEFNGTPLPFVAEANPYRAGGARIDWAAMAPLWGERNGLRVTLG